jgi:hypothetical protein
MQLYYHPFRPTRAACCWRPTTSASSSTWSSQPDERGRPPPPRGGQRQRQDPGAGGRRLRAVGILRDHAVPGRQQAGPDGLSAGPAGARGRQPLDVLGLPALRAGEPGRSSRGEGTGARSLASSRVSPRVSGGSARMPFHRASIASITGAGTPSLSRTPRPMSTWPCSIHSSAPPSSRPGIRPRATAGRSRRPRARCRRTSPCPDRRRRRGARSPAQRGHVGRVLPQLVGLGAQHGSVTPLASWRTITDAASAPRVRKPTRCTAARTLVTSLPARL